MSTAFTSWKHVGIERLGVCLEMPLSDRPFEDRFQAAADLGFSKAEMWLVDGSYSGTPEDLSRLAEEAGIELTNTVIGSPDGTVGGGLTDPSRRVDWLERARMTMEFNRRAGIGATIVCTGDELEGVSNRTVRKSVLEGLTETAELAEELQIDLILEPLNVYVDHPGYFLKDSDEAAELCREVASPRLKVLYDCYHMQVMEGDIIAHFERNLDVIGHVHLAGVPGRNEPEIGEVDYPYVLSKFAALGYQGAFGLEYMPTIDHEKSLRATARYLTGDGGA